VDDPEMFAAGIPKRQAILGGIKIHIMIKSRVIIQYALPQRVQPAHIKVAACRLLQITLDLSHGGRVGVWMLPKLAG
jgi:hypothetical protein